jgi:tetratricopeptide (TPR) repeat protein
MLAGLLVLCLVVSGRAETLDVSAAYANSYRYEKTGNYADAVRAVYPVYAAYTDAYTINLRMGWLQYNLGKYADAVKHYKAAELAVPTSLESKLGLALVYLAKEDWRLAEQKCYEILKVDYYSYYGNLRLIAALTAQGKLTEAETIARKMLAVFPTDVGFLVALGNNLVFQGRYDEATPVYSGVVTLDPENVAAKAYLRGGR